MGAEIRNVLVIYSNNRLLPANIEADRGFRDNIANAAGRNVELFAEFLDRPTFFGPAYEQTIVTYLTEKYVTHPPDVVVVSGSPALDFLLRHRAALFPGVPVVHFNVDQPFIASLPAVPADVVGVPVTYDFGSTIRLALRWHPATRRLVVVTGASVTDRRWEAEIRAAAAKLGAPPAVEFLAALPSAEVTKRLGDLGSGDVVFTPGYFRDGAGRAFLPRDSAALMAAASGAPIYSPFSTFIGTGIVGGYMPAAADMGRQAATLVNRLLDGATPAALAVPAATAAPVQIDWRQAQRWNVAAKDIPADAVVHFREPTFWEAYHDAAIIAAAVFLLQAGLIAALLLERSRRRRTAVALEESEERMSLAAHAARLSMWVWDVTRDRIWSTAKLRHHAVSPAELPVPFDQGLERMHPADRDRVDEAVRQALEKGEDLDVEYRVVQPEGGVRWIAARGRTEKGNSDRVMGVALDITARKVAELQAEQDRSALTHMTRVSMMGQLSASIAHQLNQPLAAILGNAETARKMLDRKVLDRVELKEICDDIVTEDRRAAEVIRRLGALYKRGEMKVAPFDLNDLVRETLDLVRTELMTRHVTAITELAPVLPAIDGGRVQLQQVVLNLVLNAADAMAGVELPERMLVVRTEADGAHVRLCVVDRGTGVALDDMKNVFDAFWSTKAGGMGIGLAICQSIITAHRGTLTVANNPDGGATFCATLPMWQT